MSLMLSEGTDQIEEERRRKEQGEEPEEDGYFSSYSHFGIHEEMLKVREEQAERIELEGYLIS